MENLTIEQLKNYLGTGLKFQLQSDWHEEYYEIENNYGFQEAFAKGAIWELVGRTDIAIPVSVGDLEGLILQHESGNFTSDYFDVKPIMYSLSDLDKMIPELGFVPIEEFLKTIHKTWYNSHLDSRYSEIEIDSSGNYIKAYFKYMATLEINIRLNDIENEKWWIIQKLCQWHFWVFDQSYFEKGLIIDKMTVK